MYKLRKRAERNRRLSLERNNVHKKVKTPPKRNSDRLNILNLRTTESEIQNIISNGVTHQVGDNNFGKKLAKNSSYANSLPSDNIVDATSTITKNITSNSVSKPNYAKKNSEGSFQYSFQMGHQNSEDTRSQLVRVSVDHSNTLSSSHYSSNKISNKRSSIDAKEMANGRTLPSKAMRKYSTEVGKDVNFQSEPKESQITFREALKSIALEEQQLFPLDNPRPLVPTAEIPYPASRSSSLTLLEPPSKARPPSVLNPSFVGRKRDRIVNGNMNIPNKKMDVASNFFKEINGKDAQSTTLSSIQITKKFERIKTMVSQIPEKKESRKSQKRGINYLVNQNLNIETEDLGRRMHQEICNGNTKLKRIKRKDLESLVIELFIDKVLYEHELGQQKDLCKRLEATLENNWKKTTQFHKEVNDLKKMMKYLHSVYATNKNKVIVPVWVKRSVGVQVSHRLIQNDIAKASMDSEGRISSPSSPYIMSSTDADYTIEEKRGSQPDPIIPTNHTTPSVSSSTKAICRNSFKGFDYSSHQPKRFSTQNLKTRTLASQANLSTPKANLSTPKANLSTPKANLSTPKANLSTPKANLSTPKANLSTPKANLSTPKANLSTPKANLSTPKANLSTPKANLSTPKPNVSTPKPNVSISKVNLSTSNATLSASNATLSTLKPNFPHSTQMGVAKPVMTQSCRPSMQTAALGSRVIAASTTQLVPAHKSSVPSLLQSRAESSKELETSSVIDLTEEDEGNQTSSAAVPKNTLQKSQEAVALSMNTLSQILTQNPPSSVSQSMGVPSPGAAVAPAVGANMATHQSSISRSTHNSGGPINCSSPAITRENGQPSKHPAPLPNAPPQQISGYSRKVPLAPILRLRQKEKSIILSWNMTRMEEDHEDIASYQLFAYQENSGPPMTSLWKKVGSVTALSLPMTCTLTQFLSGHVYHFAVRAVDIRGRLGPFSVPKYVFLRKQMMP